MGLYKFNNIGIEAISATVPKKVKRTSSFTDYYSKEYIDKFIEATGVEERRFADELTCASDLCYNAACEIFDSTQISRDDIDVLIFISQTPDYKIPGTSVIMQDRLDLKRGTLVYDVNMSCSGFIHGILMAYNFLQSPDINHVMIMVGDTLTRLTSIQDKGTGLLLGDAGTCTVCGKGEKFGDSYFSMCTDGSFLKSVYIPSGGMRKPHNIHTMEKIEYEDGSYRTEEQIVMVGSDVFSFAINKLPKNINNFLEFAGKSIDDINLYAFHQANNFMMDYIAKKSKVDKSKILHSIQKFGNTAGSSIPLCLVVNNELIKRNDSILMNAIGAGFVYGTALINISDCVILPLTEL